MGGRWLAVWLVWLATECGKPAVAQHTNHAGVGAPFPNDPVFHTVLVADSHWLAAARAAADAGEPEATKVALRWAEPGPDGIRLRHEWWLTLPCQRPDQPVQVMRWLQNRQGPGAPPDWESAWPVESSGPTDDSSADVDAAALHAILMGRPTDPGQLRVPSPAQVARAFLCASGAEPDAVRAEEVLKSGGLTDLERWHCPLTDASGRGATPMELAFSPAAAAVRINDRWVSEGTFTREFLAFKQDGLEVRFVRSTGALRIVHRDEMRRVGHGRCERQGSGPSATGTGALTW